jgi:UTP--glucose-1-phosphate uridylyltransferase
VHYGIAKPAGAAGPVFRLADIVEKPTIAEAPSNLAVAARYVFAPAIFELLAVTPPGKGGEIQLTDAIRALIARGGKVHGIRLPPGERRFDIGNFESYFQAFFEFALEDPKYGPGLREFVRQLLGEGTADERG